MLTYFMSWLTDPKIPPAVIGCIRITYTPPVAHARGTFGAKAGHDVVLRRFLRNLTGYVIEKPKGFLQ